MTVRNKPTVYKLAILSITRGEGWYFEFFNVVFQSLYNFIMLLLPKNIFSQHLDVCQPSSFLLSYNRCPAEHRATPLTLTTAASLVWSDMSK